MEAFLGGHERSADVADGPEVAMLGWEYDRVSGFYFQRSLGERFAEHGGVFFDGQEQEFYFFDAASMRHVPMDESQLVCLVRCASNAGVALPLRRGEERHSAPDIEEPLDEREDLLTTWSKPWEEWVEVEGAGADLELSLFAHKATRTVWNVSTGSGQLFRRVGSCCEQRGSPVLRVSALSDPPVAGGSAAGGASSTATDFLACDNVVGSASWARLALRCQDGVSRMHCSVRYHPVEHSWQIKDLGSPNGTFLQGVRLAPSTWTVLEMNAGPCHVRVGRVCLFLVVGDFVSSKVAPNVQPAIIQENFEASPAVIQGPPTNWEQRLELDNKLRKKEACRRTASEVLDDARRADSYHDKALDRRTNRCEWDQHTTELAAAATSVAVQLAQAFADHQPVSDGHQVGPRRFQEVPPADCHEPCKRPKLTGDTVVFHAGEQNH